MVQEILNGRDSFLEFLKSKGLQEEIDYQDDKYRDAFFFKIGDKKLLAICQSRAEDEVTTIKNHFLIDKGLSHLAVLLKGKVIFLRNYGERRYFVYSERTADNASKQDKLNRISENFDGIFQSKDISRRFYEEFKRERNYLVSSIENDEEPVRKYLLAQKIFDRIFFIYFLCQKHIIHFEDGRRISGKTFFNILIENGDFLDNLKKVFELFNKQGSTHVLSVDRHTLTIPYLNGGLFRQTDSEKRLRIDLTKENWRKIFLFLNEYHWIIESEIREFTEDIEDEEAKVLTPEILGHVYERSVVEWELKGFDEEVREATREITERKKKGVYYTPEEITDYLCRSAIYPYLIEREDASFDDISSFFSGAKKEDLDDALKTLSSIKILDPACGSGAFLLKAGEVLFLLKTAVLNRLGRETDYYNIKTSIITENLYGVDILEGAVEISLLRLWLWLVSSYKEDKKLHALPNIEYNLVVGDSLVGWQDEPLAQVLVPPLTTETKTAIEVDTSKEVETAFKKLLRSLTYLEEAESINKARTLLEGVKLEDYIESYGILRDIYRKSYGEEALFLKEILQTIKSSVYVSVNEAFLNHISTRTKPKRRRMVERQNTLESFQKLTPLHYHVDFGNIAKDGGFDIILTNPPYGNILKDSQKEFMPHYKTGNANEIAANFVERSLKLVKKNGHIGFVVANSIAINRDTAPARESIRQTMARSKMALFGTRPQKIFADAEIRVLLFYGEKDEPKRTGVIYTTEMIKFNEEQRATLLSNLTFESSQDLTLGKRRIGDGLEDASLAKVGNSMIRNILLKLKDKSDIVLGDVIDKTGASAQMEFRKTGGYWLNALEKMPYRSTKIEALEFRDSLERDFCILLINSSLLYLFWSSYSNLRDFPLSLLEKFPFPASAELKENAEAIQDLTQKISDCLLKSFQPERGRVGEFKTALCKSIIDSIDDLLGEIYGLDSAEVQFVKAYDTHIRR